MRLVADERAELLERAGVEEDVEPLAGGELALLVLLRDAGLAAAELGFGAALVQVFYEGVLRHGTDVGVTEAWGRAGKFTGRARTAL